ncbi:Piso0_000702 [Millerozyma farinosa CBS 7064]|uniref:Piso0_000702 protein n=1 Tax=Pichia sorbitophila (strain ATCC MYA-4447 / BCRC 22081 / CBS 7064 / NBRC 10061 / NRRL Y-12695) TaxID=559304 RepID=G8YRA2_PICSO|nr:Piso0_000702 [Millerozyma farinosa CBS 7064]
MSSITLHISFDNVTKKLTYSKTQTINEVLRDCTVKFKIPGSAGELRYNGKKLDDTLPIRLTNLINNSKVVFEKTNEKLEKDVNLKIVWNHKADVRTFVERFKNSLTPREIIQTIEKKHHIEIEKHGVYEINILDRRMRSDSNDLSKALVELVGSSASSMVARISYITNGKTEEQDKINELQKNQMSQYQARLREEAHRKELAEKEKMAKEAEQVNNATTSTDIQSTEPDVPEPQLSDKPSINKESDQLVRQENEAQRDVDEGNGAVTNARNMEVEQEAKDTIYIPSSFRTYENPDTDYNMTVDQAKKYHKSVVNSRMRPRSTTEKRKPTKYLIRIRFPDRNILQLNIADAHTSLGQLCKRIDEYLVPQYQRNYNLKIAYPPFSLIPLSLSTNSTPLQELPQFQDEKLTLIWEPLEKAAGPFLERADVEIKESNRLPELVLEQNRNSLPDSSVSHADAAVPTSLQNASGNRSLTSSSAKSKFPKWFRSK